MSDDTQLAKAIFSYGTLMDKFPDAVVEDAELSGRFIFDDSGMFPSVRPAEHHSCIPGKLIYLTPNQLKIADEYEDGLYKRVELSIDLKLGGSIKAEVYLEF